MVYSVLVNKSKWSLCKSEYVSYSKIQSVAIKSAFEEPNQLDEH